MSNTIVSIRMPETMAKSLKATIKENHYLDVSEAIRSIVRKKWREYKDPSTYQIRKLRTEIKDTVKEQSKKTKEDILLNELQRIKDMLSEQEVER